MNNNDFSQVLQQGFHIVVGAVTSLVETAQNPEKRTEVLSELRMEFNQKTREWAIKGETTEQEARKIVDNFLRQRNWQDDVNFSDRTSNDDEINLSSGLQQLQNDLIALRLELAKMRESKE
jgi:polyhydroxyalkanoate synthesis regulator phasin